MTDTSVVIDYERSNSARLQQIIKENDAAVCGITIAELYAGTRTFADEARCQIALAEFQQLPFPEPLWETVGRNQAKLRSAGITVQLTDTAIASLALDANIELWSYDAHFTLMQKVLTALKLFREPP